MSPTDGGAADPADSDASRVSTEASAGSADEGSGTTTGVDPPSDASTRRLGWRGWLLVVAVVIAFIGVPLVILFKPPSLPFLFAYLALPLLPAFLLAAIAVWVALPREQE